MVAQALGGFGSYWWCLLLFLMLSVFFLALVAGVVCC